MLKKQILIATTNNGKLREIRKLLRPYLGPDYRLINAKSLQTIPKVKEDGRNYLSNAMKKAKAYSVLSKTITISDDSGLEVRFLSEKPGVKSARFAGKPYSDQRNIQKLLRLLKKVPLKKRRARFVCNAVAYFPESKKLINATGYVKGFIAESESGKQGFGYDPVFYYPPFKKTFGEISSKRKNSVSHRAIAFDRLGKKIKKILNPLI